jgi:hypothetical protein
LGPSSEGPGLSRASMPFLSRGLKLRELDRPIHRIGARLYLGAI